MGFAAYDVLRSGVEHDDLQAVGSTTWFIVIILDADLLEPSLAVPCLCNMHHVYRLLPVSVKCSIIHSRTHAAVRG